MGAKMHRTCAQTQERGGEKRQRRCTESKGDVRNPLLSLLFVAVVCARGKGMLRRGPRKRYGAAGAGAGAGDRVGGERAHLLEVGVGVGRVARRHDGLDDLAEDAGGGSVERGALVAELVERRLAVVVAVARRAGAAKGQRVDGKVEQRVALHARARARVVKEELLDLGVAGEEVGALVDVDGRLAAELERGGAEPLGGLFGDDAADGAVAGVEDVFEALVEHRRGLGDAAVDDAEAFRVEVLVPQLGEQLGRVAGHLGGLEEHRVAGGDGADHGAHLDGDGVVPGAEDEHGALGLGADRGAVGSPGEAGPGLGGLGPLVELVDGLDNLVGGAHELGKDALEARTAEILLERLDKVVLVVLEHVGELLELVLAVLDRARLAGQEGGAKVRDDAGDGIDGCVLEAGLGGGGGCGGHVCGVCSEPRILMRSVRLSEPGAGTRLNDKNGPCCCVTAEKNAAQCYTDRDNKETSNQAVRARSGGDRVQKEAAAAPA
ncbi:hypothetical protein L1887_45982 [Cichorium endivia]|nr:hypothetical protein L1887_45982 [Cichorium endivia]